ncbi:MAG: hypothetical protein AAB581_00900 [Patescibacteria group bacterium]
MEQGKEPNKEMEEFGARIKAMLASLSEQLARIQKEHREQINGILKNIDAKKIKDLKDKLAHA